MKYFVIGADGTKFGPADIPVLNTWIADSRLMPMMMLEEEGTGRQLLAKDLDGLQFPPFNAPPQQMPGISGPVEGYYNRPSQTSGSDGKVEIIIAWILGVIGFAFCPVVISTIGIVLATQARKKGHPAAQATLFFCIASLVIGMIFGAIVGMRNAQHMLGR